MRNAVFIGRISTWSWAQISGFLPQKSRKKNSFDLHYTMHRAHTSCTQFDFTWS